MHITQHQRRSKRLHLTTFKFSQLQQLQLSKTTAPVVSEDGPTLHDTNAPWKVVPLCSARNSFYKAMSRAIMDINVPAAAKVSEVTNRMLSMCKLARRV
ncbi:hypothetical protein AAF712_005221 [Marasmius tenuissimus]|uniref:Uncharacterized protein n=1 Tax=Marasmius tenuissimus TaxID=585030 RepID=A0ABR3A1P0_9AGAR